MFNKIRGICGAVLLTAGFFGSASRANAEPTQTFSNWLEDVKYSGDLRLRHETFNKKTAGQSDRARERFRLRVNTDFKLPNRFMVRMTFASGTGEQVSTNQSFDGLSSQKSLWIDKIYATWKPFENYNVNLQAGRMENPIWRAYSSDAVWDGDFNPEGYSASYSQLVGPVNMFVTGLHMIVDEDSSYNNSEGVTTNRSNTFGPSDRDQRMSAGQIGAEFRLPLESRLKVAYANYNWVNERFGDFGAGVNNEGNRRTVASSTGSLVNNFNVDEVTAVLSSWILRLPVQVQGTYIKNRGARKDFAVNGAHKEDTGFQVGGIVGKASTKNSWEVAYFRKHVRTDATVADISDSDFGDGGTNREGNIMWLAFAPRDWMVVSLKHFQTKVINVALAPGRDDVNRTQIDWSLKF